MLKIDIANLALAKLGTSLYISDLVNEQSNQAKIIRRLFSVAFDRLLELHDWHFLSKYAELSLVSEDETLPYRYLYSVPADARTIREIASEGGFTAVDRYEESKIRWEYAYDSGGAVRIRTNLPDAWARYTVKPAENYNFPPHFGRALAAQLAIEIAPSLITNNFPKIKQTLASELKSEVNEGIADDMGKQPRRLESYSPFVLARQ
jgi:hypothetical protein